MERCRYCGEENPDDVIVLHKFEKGKTVPYTEAIHYNCKKLFDTKILPRDVPDERRRVGCKIISKRPFPGSNGERYIYTLQLDIHREGIHQEAECHRVGILGGTSCELYKNQLYCDISEHVWEIAQMN